MDKEKDTKCICGHELAHDIKVNESIKEKLVICPKCKCDNWHSEGNIYHRVERGHKKWIKRVKGEHLTVFKTAKLLDRHPKTIQRWFDAGILKGFRHPVNNYRMIPMSEVQKILDQCRAGD